MKVSRRDFLYGTGSAVAASLVIPQSIALADANHDALRARWRTLLLGSGYDPNVEPYDSVLSDLGAEAAGYLATLESGHWPDDLPIGGNPDCSRSSDANIDRSARLSDSFGRVYAMAKAYSLPNTGFTGDVEMRNAIITALDTLTTMDGGYSVAECDYGNWYVWFISVPKKLLNIMTLMYDQLTAAKRASYIAALDRFVRGSRLTDEKGANRMDIALVLVLRGILGATNQKIVDGTALLTDIFRYVDQGAVLPSDPNGAYRDGSIIQHGNIPYNGTYGAVMLSGVASICALLRGSAWEVTDPYLPNVYEWVEKSFAPFLYNGLMMDGMSGRGIAIETKHDHQRGRGVMTSILLLGEGAPATQQLRWKRLVKGWLQRDYWYPLATNPITSIPDAVRVHALMNDASITPLAEPSACVNLPRTDRVVHRRPGWALAISMCSTRTTFYENGNGENLRGWHTNSGMVYWWGHDFGNGQYSDAFWPTVDPYRLPGTTVSKKALSDGAGGDWGEPVPTNDWAGGATNGVYGVFGQTTQGLSSTLRAKKSWFCLSDMVVCLGAGISSTDGANVGTETIVENRNLGSGGGQQSFSVNGVNQSTSLTWSATLPGTRWAHLNGFGGYVFYGTGGATLKGLRQQRTKSWRDINDDASTTPVQRKYLTLYYDHGANPTNGTYAYALMPGATAAQTQARSDAGTAQLTVLENRKEIQAVSAPGFLGINFWNTAYSTQTISVDGLCSVMVHGPNGDGHTELWLADATQAVSQPITLTWNRWVPFVLQLDPGVTIVEYTIARLRLRFDVVGKRGASMRALVRL